MHTCNTALRVMWGHRFYLFVYVVAMSVMVVILGYGVVRMTTGSEGGASVFTIDQAAVAVVDRDSGSPIGAGLRRQMASVATPVELEDTERGLQDAVATNQVDLIVIVPDGFGEQFRRAALDGDAVPRVETVTSVNSAKGSMASMQVNGFLAALRTALIGSADTGDGAADAPLRSAVDRVLAASRDARADGGGTVGVVTVSGTAADDDVPATSTVTGFSVIMMFQVFPTFAVMMLYTSLIVSRFNEPDTRRRLFAAPVRGARMAVSMLGACVLASVAVWCWYAALALGFAATIGDGLAALRPGNVAFALLAAFVYTVMSMAFGFMIGAFGMGNAATNGIATVVGMAMMFLSGTLLPESMTPTLFVDIGRMTPGWWYAQAVYGALGTKDVAAVGAGDPQYDVIAQALGMLALFALAFVCIGLAVSRVRQTRASAPMRTVLAEC